MDDLKFCKIEIFIPDSYLAILQQALLQVEAGHIGNYDGCITFSRVTGCWRPLSGSNPYIGRQDVFCEEPELKVEVVCLREKLDQTLEAIKGVHPYETPVINVIALYRTSY